MKFISSCWNTTSNTLSPRASACMRSPAVDAACSRARSASSLPCCGFVTSSPCWRCRGPAAEPAPARPAVPYLIHVGRFTGQKRHDLLLDAFAQLDIPHPLVLLAEPDPALSDLIRKHGLDGRVIVAGFKANPYPWIVGAELLVLCSDHEGLPNVII